MNHRFPTNRGEHEHKKAVLANFDRENFIRNKEKLTGDTFHFDSAGDFKNIIERKIDRKQKRQRKFFFLNRDTSQ